MNLSVFYGREKESKNVLKIPMNLVKGGSLSVVTNSPQNQLHTVTQAGRSGTPSLEQALSLEFPSRRPAAGVRKPTAQLCPRRASLTISGW